jgi:hypothetical protein
MPPITRWFIKTSLVFLVAALVAAVLLAAQSLWRFSPYLAGFGPAYFHLFMVGWITELIFGVAIWMLPKFTSQQPRGNEKILWATYALLNAGLALRIVAEPFNSLTPGSLWGYGVVLSALLQWLAGMGFVVNAWPRVKEK